MKRIISSILCFSLITNLAVQAVAVEETDPAREAQLEVIEAYDRLYEECDHDEERAMEELLELYPSLEVVDSSVTYFDENGKEIKNARSNMTYVNLEGESLVYDNDWDTYVYFGYWMWTYAPDENRLAPYDVVGFYTQSDTEMYPLDYFVYGYNTSGNQVAYYNTVSGERSGYIAKGEDTTWGAAFWIDDNYVRSGRMVVPIDYTPGSNKKVITKYCHSWTTTNITGIGGSVSVGAYGFNISWDTSVRHWESIATSSGVRLP